MCVRVIIVITNTPPPAAVIAGHALPVPGLRDGDSVQPIRNYTFRTLRIFANQALKQVVSKCKWDNCLEPEIHINYKPLTVRADKLWTSV